MVTPNISFLSRGNVYIVNGETDGDASQSLVITSRQSLRNALQDNGFNVMSFNGPVDFLKQLKRKLSLKLSLPAILLFDTRLNDWSGLELQHELNQLEHAVPMIFLGNHQDYRQSVTAMKQGAIDFWGSPYTLHEIIGTVEIAMALNIKNSAFYLAEEGVKVRLNSLTSREREICFLMVRGYGNIEIAAINGTTAGTVKVHRSRVLQKMGADNLSSLVTQMSTFSDEPH
jgi:two-component system response regulator FixJ